ncbi:MAG: methylated-DNA--[protein]-cysteine S-methyltransferase [Verrucomicrobia bacterium]|jgi:O-6-methylguanine DNA methyltransferase|nr:methylated-DNA--[protein]-cysteine S-methyltransferase [Verrucomicrobiota bacterium]
MNLEAAIPLSLWETTSPADTAARLFPLSTPFGKATVGLAGDALVWFGFGPRSAAEFRRDWPGRVVAEGDGPRGFPEQLRALLLGESALPLKPVGTPFQLLTWQILLAIPFGATVGYGELAEQMGSARYTRAAARAIARNPVSWVIPCHRVIPETAGKGGYRWGRNRKNRLLHWEQETDNVAPTVSNLKIS